MKLKSIFIYNMELAKKASNHHEWIEANFQNETKNSIINSKIYIPEKCKKSNIGIKPIIQLIDIDTVSALYLIKDFYFNIGVLNFASFKYASGMYMSGSSAQEESLSHESNLYEILSYFNPTYYEKNRIDCKSGKLNNLYADRGIYSPNVLFIRNNEKVFTNIISVASPNMRLNYNNIKSISPIDNSIALDNRIKFILDIAETENLKTLILGSFGCGVFKQDPIEVASIFKKYLLSQKYNFTNIIFAIPNSNSNNYKVFASILEDSLSGIFINN